MWAPDAKQVELELTDSGRHVPLALGNDTGAWSAHVADARPGTRYRYRLNGNASYPDPYSRSQPEGPHGPSAVVDPPAFPWSDRDWRGLSIQGLVIYQLHVGTFTPAGTFEAVIDQLPRLQSLGVNAIQLLPVAEFPGQRNWGYDGVDLFAPSHVYGGPPGLKRLIDAGHGRGLGVILDVVYNHLGPDGNYLGVYSENYFNEQHQTPWGPAINYDGPGSGWVRKLVIDNARYWLHEYHADGLRLDATHAMVDRSSQHILAELTQAVHTSISRETTRQIVLIAESSENDVRYLQPVEQGGFGFDAAYADDFHHALRRYFVGDREGYYADYVGTLDEAARCIEQGWLYEGQPTPRSGFKEARGTPARDRPAHQFVYALQNHDQVGNRPFGDRLNQQIPADQFAAASMLLLFLPYTPMLFMGQEFGASSPFLFFTDHSPELGRLVTTGRREEFKAFSAFSDPQTRERIPDPQAESTFLASKLRLAEAEVRPGADLQALYTRLLALRRDDPVLRLQDRGRMEARALSRDVIAVRRWLDDREQRLLLANFGEREARVDQFAGGWRVLAESGRSTQSDSKGVTVTARSATILASGNMA